MSRSQVASYLASLPPDARKAARKLRAAIRAAAPRAVEGFSYGIPLFRLETLRVRWQKPLPFPYSETQRSQGE